MSSKVIPMEKQGKDYLSCTSLSQGRGAYSGLYPIARQSALRSPFSWDKKVGLLTKGLGVLGKTTFFLALVLFFFLLGGQEAEAWGPGVHMVTGNWLLQNLTALPTDIAASIMAHPGQFLYGILSPDIFIGKGSLNKKGHSHNWQTGLLLLRLAETAEQEAYAYGYLSHLSADTVAHNVFVPQSSEAAVGSGRLAHVYLEMQADRVLDWDSKDALGVFRERPSAASAALLQKTMRQTPWTFWMKKFLFKQSIFFGGLPTWRSAMGFLDSVVVGPEGVAFAEQMLVVSTRAMVSLLQDVRNSPVRSLDPIGAEALEGFRGQSRSLAQSLMENLFPRLMQKHWANALFYSDTFAPRAEKDFDRKGDMAQSPQADSQNSDKDGSGSTIGETGGRSWGQVGGKFADKSEEAQGGERCASETQGIPVEDMTAYLDKAMTEKMEFLHSLDKGSPIVEEGFSLPDVLKELPPVCVP